jgi:hypothetical protein
MDTRKWLWLVAPPPNRKSTLLFAFAMGLANKSSINSNTAVMTAVSTDQHNFGLASMGFS